jgi:hypothetical protein
VNDFQAGLKKEFLHTSNVAVKMVPPRIYVKRAFSRYAATKTKQA